MTVRSPARAQGAPSVGLQRRRELRRRKRMHLAAQLWSLLLLLSASAGLGWLLLRHGWLLRTPAQVQLSNRSQFNRDQVISVLTKSFGDTFVIGCQESGKDLFQIEFCLQKDFQGRNCGKSANSNCSSRIRIPN